MENMMPFIWIGFAVLLAVCEVYTVQLVSIWFMLGAICAAITTIFTDSILIQSTVFLVVSLVAVLATRPLVKRLKRKLGDTPTNANRLIGQIGVITIDIPSTEDVGQVKVCGQTWSAKSANAPINKESKVKVLSIEGVKLIVEPA
jgi:membrane protein implicated in regulation of membrane protease activity